MFDDNFDPLTDEVHDINYDIIPDDVYQQWRTKQAKSLDYCGCIWSYRDGETGLLKSYHKPCNHPDCKFCGPRIRKNMSETISSILRDRPLRVVELTGTPDELSQQRAKLIRKYGGEKYFSTATDYQNEDGDWQTKLEIVIDTDDEVGQEYTDLKDEDVDRWITKSFSVKKSGNLLKSSQPSSTHPKKEGELIEVEEMVLSTSNFNEVAQLDQQATKDTGDLDPKTLEEVQEAIAIRNARFEELLNEKGIVILDKEKRFITVDISKVNWKKPNHH